MNADETTLAMLPTVFLERGGGPSCVCGDHRFPV